jgi:hypothetical protein
MVNSDYFFQLGLIFSTPHATDKTKALLNSKTFSSYAVPVLQ